MLVSEFISKLKLAHDVPNYYNNHFPYNCGYYDGSRFSFDCWNLIKAILGGWTDNRTPGYYVPPKDFPTGDVDGYHLLMQCTDRSKDFSKLKQPGTYLYISNSPHAGVYIGDFSYQGEIFNVVECTGAWASKVQYTYVDEKGGRYLYKGGQKSPYSWTDYGLLTPYIDYGSEPKPDEPFSAFAIDVSIHQKGLALAKAKEEGFDHIIIRAGGGGNYSDPLFNDFFTQAKDGSWKIASYYYGNCYTLEKVSAEAEHFIELLKGKDIKRVFYDVEGNMLNQDKTMLTNIILTFCEILESAGYICGIYSSESHFNSKFEDERLSKYPHWVAKYSTLAPTLNSGNKVMMWQFGGGKVNHFRSPLISGVRVDQNLLLKEWDEPIGEYILDGLDYSPVFDPEFYVNKYADLETVIGHNPEGLWNHFCLYGMKEFRQASANFNPQIYKDRYKDLQEAFGKDNPKYYWHYVAFGINENRTAI